MLHSWLTIPFLFFSFLRHASAFTWSFTSQPIQCQNLSIAIQGSGQPPYSLLLIPSGSTPLPNNVEVRNVQNISFSGTSTTLSFNLNYPEHSSFVAVVSDSSGFGTGGTSAPVTVLPSSDSSCYDPSSGIQLPWVFYLDPPNGLAQCETVRWWWGRDLVNGTVNFYGVIPGGDSFIIPQGPLSTTGDTGTGFNWVVDMTPGTGFIIVGGDGRGIGTGGRVDYSISPSADTNCLSGTFPSSTAGSPAGGSIPTSTSLPASSGNSRGGSSGRSNTAAIAGGIAGGLVAVVAIALIAFFYPRRRGSSTISEEHAVDVLHDGVSPLGLPHHYTIEPYLVSDPTIGGPTEAAFARYRPLTQTLVGMTSAKQATRGSGSLPLPNSVNIIQHDDAGPSEWPSSVGENETIELPPAYGNIRSGPRSPDTASTPTTTSILTPTTMKS